MKSIVDTWDWDKLDTSTYDEPIKMTADMKVQIAINEFENHTGVRPNKIIMGYKLVDELHRQFIQSVISIREIDRELGKSKRMYENIPVEIDCDDANRLEVGYMVKWFEQKY